MPVPDSEFSHTFLTPRPLSFCPFSKRNIFETRRYSLPLRIEAIKRGLRRPCITAITHNGFLSGA